MRHLPPQTMSFNAASPNAITTEQIQKCLDDNKNLILAIMENQNLGKFQECAQYQAMLQKNLMYLAAIADAQPPPATPTPTPQTSNPSQVMQMPQQTNNYMQQTQKVPFQMNAQQQQLLQFQQQQQLQAQTRPGAQNGMLTMHQAMQSALGSDGKGKPCGAAGNRDL